MTWWLGIDLVGVISTLMSCPDLQSYLSVGKWTLLSTSVTCPVGVALSAPEPTSRGLRCWGSQWCGPISDIRKLDAFPTSGEDSSATADACSITSDSDVDLPFVHEIALGCFLLTLGQISDIHFPEVIPESDVVGVVPASHRCPPFACIKGFPQVFG